MSKRIINWDDYPMILDNSGYKNTSTKLPCKCEECGEVIEKSIEMIDRNGLCLCKLCVGKRLSESKSKNPTPEEYPMVLDWSGYKTKNASLLPCKCDGCGGVVNKTLNKLDGQIGCYCRSCAHKIKAAQTNIEKYGVSHPSKSEDIKNKKKITTLKNYGYTNPAQSPEIQEKMKQTNLERYGYENAALNKNVKEKTKQTNLERYGSISSAQNEEIQEKMKQTNLERYGYENAALNKNVKEKTAQTNLKRYGYIHPFESPEVQEKSKQTNLKKYGVPYYCLTEHYQKSSNIISKINLKWVDLLRKHFNVDCETEFVIDKYSYDIKIENLLIEINPTFSHNSTYAYDYVKGFTYDNNPISYDYHFNKWKVAHDNGYTLISVYDNMNECKILNTIRSKIGKNEISIGARKCEVKNIIQNECNFFLEKYHVQGKTIGQKVCIGLFYNNSLVGVMSFGQPRFNKNFKWELIRLCFKENMSIPGGVSKMWQYFKKINNPTNCICYLNLNLGGDQIHLSDFKFIKYNKPGGYWIHTKTAQIVTNNSLRMRGASRFIGDDNLTKYPKGMDNREIMRLEGFVEMYDNGNAVYHYNDIG